MYLFLFMGSLEGRDVVLIILSTVTLGEGAVVVVAAAIPRSTSRKVAARVELLAVGLPGN